VRPDSAGPQGTAVPVRDDAADVIAGHRSTGLVFGQGAPRFEDRLFGRGDRRLERNRDLLVRETAQLPHDQSRALAVRKRLQVGNELLQPLALRRPCLHIGTHRGYIFGNLVLDPALSQDRDRLVVSDPEQPWPHRSVAAAGSKSAVGRGKCRLERILSIGFVTYDRAAVAVERRLVALVQGRERPLAAIAGQARQTLVFEAG
jgi:hypothetical protein